MTDTDRLAALLHAEFWTHTGHGRDKPECDICFGTAARLVAQGVRVGDDSGLRAALEAIRDSEPHHTTWDGWREVTRLRDIARAALAASPAPTLDRERLARALEEQRRLFLDQPESFDSTEAVAAAIADAYEAEP